MFMSIGQLGAHFEKLDTFFLKRTLIYNMRKLTKAENFLNFTLKLKIYRLTIKRIHFRFYKKKEMNFKKMLNI